MDRKIHLFLSYMGLILSPALAHAVTPHEQLASYVKAAGVPANPAAGQQFFTEKHGKDWSCATCHSANPAATGKHATTGKAITALAPAADVTRFTDVAKTEKWFKRNCNDVLGRECSASEKANLLAWLVTVK
jgi:mono/diheme cytochrome c family protein